MAIGSSIPNQDDLQRVLSMVRPMCAQVYEERRKLWRENAPYFSVFKDIGLAHHERIFHVPMLAMWLNPEGRHGQGGLFLRSFLGEVCRLAKKHEPCNPDRYNWIVEREVATDQGNLDLCVRTRDESAWCIVVEAKIGASDQKKQLWRYHRWLQGQEHKNRLLVYLTRCGVASKEGGGHARAEMAEYICMTWEHVRRAFESSAGSVEAEEVKIVLRQYCESIPRA